MATDKHVTRTGDDYAVAFSRLLPRGMAWPRTSTSTLMKVAKALSQIWGDVETAASKLLEIDTDPRKTHDMLVEWEHNWHLPDHYVRVTLTETQRRTKLVWKMTLQGGQSRQFFVALGTALGYTVPQIKEFSPYQCGISRVGDTTGLDIYGDYRWGLGRPEMRFYWRTVVTDDTDGIVGDIEFYNAAFSPAHVQAQFDFSALASLNFTKLYNSGYAIILLLA